MRYFVIILFLCLGGEGGRDISAGLNLCKITFLLISARVLLNNSWGGGGVEELMGSTVGKSTE